MATGRGGGWETFERAIVMMIYLSFEKTSFSTRFIFRLHILHYMYLTHFASPPFLVDDRARFPFSPTRLVLPPSLYFLPAEHWKITR
jgi:hypothetical protein